MSDNPSFSHRKEYALIVWNALSLTVDAMLFCQVTGSKFAFEQMTVIIISQARHTCIHRMSMKMRYFCYATEYSYAMTNICYSADGSKWRGYVPLVLYMTVCMVTLLVGFRYTNECRSDFIDQMVDCKDKMPDESKMSFLEAYDLVPDMGKKGIKKACRWENLSFVL